MKLHEYQSKELFASYGIPVPRGHTAASGPEAVRAAGDLGGGRWVVKAQVHAGGRGKAGGVRLVEDADALEGVAEELLSRRLITPQSAPEGQPVNRVLVEATCVIGRELYLGAVIDRASERLVFMGSEAGGMDIEEVAASRPEAILKEVVDPVAGLQPYQCRRIAFGLGLQGGQVGALTRLMTALYRLFMERDASLVEINPLVVTEGGELLALDAKVNLDDNALYRHETLAELADPTQEDEREHRARQFGLNYVHLGGNIGCMVNGAGLAMATMDLIQLHGGEPANFLDVGGSTNADRVAEAFRLILSDRRVRAILVNIFGGIVRCDLIAEGIIKAVEGVGISVPVVVRLEGTNVEAGRRLLEESGLRIIAAAELAEAAEHVVAAAGGE